MVVLTSGHKNDLKILSIPIGSVDDRIFRDLERYYMLDRRHVRTLSRSSPDFHRFFFLSLFRPRNYVAKYQDDVIDAVAVA